MSSSSGSHAWIHLWVPLDQNITTAMSSATAKAQEDFRRVCAERGTPLRIPRNHASARQGEQIQVNVLSNDADADVKALRVVNVSSPNTLKGSVAIGADGVSISYSAPQDFAGTEVFRYEVVNRFGARSSSNCHDRGKWQRSPNCTSTSPYNMASPYDGTDHLNGLRNAVPSPAPPRPVRPPGIPQTPLPDGYALPRDGRASPVPPTGSSVQVRRPVYGPAPSSPPTQKYPSAAPKNCGGYTCTVP